MHAEQWVRCAGRGLANMDMGQGTWGSLGDMTSLSNRGGSLLTDLDPARVSIMSQPCCLPLQLCDLVCAQ